MLVLSRKPGEVITIGKNAEIKIVFVEIGDKKAKVAIAAPREIPVHRKEIYEKIMAIKNGEARIAKIRNKERAKD
jgi:carbon storage regulator